MAYTVPNSFTDGTLITVAEMEENIADLQKYVDGGMVAGDIDSAVFERRHLMRGYYRAADNNYQFITGIVQGLQDGEPPRAVTTPVLLRPYVSYWNTFRVSASDDDDTRVNLPGCSLTFTLEATADVFFQWRGEPIVINDSDGTPQEMGGVQIVINGGHKGETEQWFIEETGTYGIERRHILQSFTLVKGLSAGTYNVSLVGLGAPAKMALIAWSLSLEAYYT